MTPKEQLPVGRSVIVMEWIVQITIFVIVLLIVTLGWMIIPPMWQAWLSHHP